MKIRPGPRFGHRNGSDEFPTRQARQIFPLLLLGPVVQQIVRYDRVDRGIHSRQAAARHAIVKDRFVPKIASAAAIFARDVRTEKSKRSSLQPEFVPDIASFARLFIQRRHFLVDEATDRVSVHLELRIEPRGSIVDHAPTHRFYERNNYVRGRLNSQNMPTVCDWMAAVGSFGLFVTERCRLQTPHTFRAAEGMRCGSLRVA